MLDDSDVDFAWLLVIFSNGWTVVIAGIIAVVIFIAVLGNHEDCAKKQCPAGQSPRLLDHSCLCVGDAR